MAYRNWTNQEEVLLKELVATGKYSYRQMEVFFPGRTFNSLLCHARQYLNIFNDKYEQRKYSYDRHFFDKPSIVNSYVAGFLAADGCVQLNEKQGPTLTLAVIGSDLDHLNNLKSLLAYTGPTMTTEDMKRNLVRFRICCSNDYIKKMADNFGIIPLKTHHLTPPALPTQDLRLAFLLGLLDGDGCVHIEKNSQVLSISFASASLKAVEWYKQVMEELDLPTIRQAKPVNVRKLSHAEAYGLTYAGSRAVAFVKLIQHFSRVHNLPTLKRKWDNPRLNQYILDFEAKYPTFSYNPSILV